MNPRQPAARLGAKSREQSLFEYEEKKASGIDPFFPHGKGIFLFSRRTKEWKRG